MAQVVECLPKKSKKRKKGWSLPVLVGVEGLTVASEFYSEHRTTENF
jgi:hypothetical protein